MTEPDDRDSWAEANGIDLTAIHPMIVREWKAGHVSPWHEHLFKPRPQRPDGPVAATDDPAAARWCQSALDASCEEMRQAPEGVRNHTLYKKAFRLGTLVHGGYLDEEAAFDGLADAASYAGLGTVEVHRTIRSGFRDAANEPAQLHLDDQGDAYPGGYTIDPDELGTPADEDEETWEPVDLGPYLDGSWERTEPTLLVRDDGHALLYKGHVHWFHGESESGKSWIAQFAAACVLDTGGSVLYIDHESSAGELVERMLSMGVSPEAVAERFHYVQPERPAGAERDAFARLLARHYTLAVIDGVTESVVLDGVESKDNDAIAAWIKRLPRRLARRTGAAVVCIDHVAKNTETRGRFAIGGQHKIAGLDGAAYLVEPIEPLGRGICGSLKMSVAKDRQGGVRPYCGAYNKVTRLQEAARVRVDSTDGDRTLITVLAPDAEEQGEEWRPTELMERVSRFVEEHPMASGKLIEDWVTGKASRVREAIKWLISDGYLEQKNLGTGKQTTHQMIRPYRRSRSIPELPEFDLE